MVIILTMLIVLQLIAIFGSIAMIGQPREPRTATEAAITVMFGILMIAFYMWVIITVR